MIQDEIKTKLEEYIAGNGTLSDRECVLYTKMLLDEIAALNNEIIEKDKVIKENIQTTMENLAAVMLKGLNLK